MQLRPANQIPSLIKALTEVVLPAIDPANTLAQEQARLVIGTLAAILPRLALEYRYDRDELQRSLALAQRLQAALPGAAGAATSLQELAASAAIGAAVMERARAEPAELQEAVRGLRSSVGALIQAVYAQDDSTARASVSTLVQDAAGEQLLRERAWLVGYGFEPDPALIPPIESLLAPVKPAE